MSGFGNKVIEAKIKRRGDVQKFFGYKYIAA